MLGDPHSQFYFNFFFHTFFIVTGACFPKFAAKKGPVPPPPPPPFPSPIFPESLTRYSISISLISSSIAGSLPSSKMNIKYRGDL
jgi:hypothetical protein